MLCKNREQFYIWNNSPFEDKFSSAFTFYVHVSEHWPRFIVTCESIFSFLVEIESNVCVRNLIPFIYMYMFIYNVSRLLFNFLLWLHNTYTNSTFLFDHPSYSYFPLVLLYNTFDYVKWISRLYVIIRPQAGKRMAFWS